MLLYKIDLNTSFLLFFSKKKTQTCLLVYQNQFFLALLVLIYNHLGGWLGSVSGDICGKDFTTYYYYFYYLVLLTTTYIRNHHRIIYQFLGSQGYAGQRWAILHGVLTISSDIGCFEQYCNITYPTRPDKIYLKNN